MRILALCVALTLPALANAQSTVQRAERAYANIKTLRATFEQTVTNPLTRTNVTSHGELQQKIPGSVSVKFTDPAGDRIVANGKVVWLYLPSTNPGQVLKSTLDSSTTAVPDVASWFLNSPSTRYAISDAGTAMIAGHATHVVTLIPKDPSLPFTKATIWVDDDDALIRQVETLDANGLARRITLTRLVPNATLDRDAFDFKVPKGVRVYETG
jgi:outer membrane lipoprotein carrier protein